MATSRTTGGLAVLAVVVTAVGALVSLLGLPSTAHLASSAVVLAVVVAVALLGAAIGSRAARRLDTAYW